MSQPTRGQEAEEASFAFQAALASLGLSTIEDAQAMWDDLPIGAKAATATRWMNEALRYIKSRRVEARALGMAYYRLTRALRTGTTIVDPYKPTGKQTVTMKELRDEFQRLADSANESLGHSVSSKDTTEPSEAVSGDSGNADGGSRTPVETDFKTDNTGLPNQDEPVDDDEVIRLEEIKNLKAELEQMEREAEAEAEELLRVLGLENEQRKLEELARKRDQKDAVKKRQQVHDDVGNRQAAMAGRLVMNGARGAVYVAGDNDDKVQGWVRVSSTGTPCGWCAMLISRGPVYKSSKQAGGRQEQDGTREAGAAEYHDNDYCYAMPVYSDKEYNTSARFALNRKYAKEWKSVTAGLSGDAALSKWRKHIRNSKKQAQAA